MSAHCGQLKLSTVVSTASASVPNGPQRIDSLSTGRHAQDSAYVPISTLPIVMIR